ncbi:hypothetical protein C8D88_117114 [Lentzea atacamensis]|uniref:DUF11 domain-containing protein n=2 Tax=Lentzea atacamensis TaxID=531938 RepID=A0A316HLC9_9PSEU|nr:hypothetical protein C8D88_117114 [Lentzea atacamensis]
MTALPGQKVKFSTTVTNTGDTPLFDLRARTTTDGCNTTQGRLAPGATATADCATQAGDESGMPTSTVTATDKLGKKVETSTSVQVKVINPQLTITALWPKDRVEDGELVTITVTVGNPSAQPISDVEVAGEPAACRRTLPVLQPRERLTCTCRAAAPVNSRLTVSGAGAGNVISESAVVRIDHHTTAAETRFHRFAV